MVDDAPECFQTRVGCLPGVRTKLEQKPADVFVAVEGSRVSRGTLVPIHHFDFGTMFN